MSRHYLERKIQQARGVTHTYTGYNCEMLINASLFTMWKICHKSRHILTNFFHKKADMQYLIPTTHFIFVLQCSAALNRPGSVYIFIAEQVFACCSFLTTFSWKLYLEFERGSYGEHLKEVTNRQWLIHKLWSGSASNKTSLRDSSSSFQLSHVWWARLVCTLAHTIKLEAVECDGLG